MTEKKKSWGINLDAAKKEAKTSIQKTSHSKPKPKPKKKPGPKGQDEKLKRVMVHESAHQLARELAAKERVTIIEYVSELIRKEAKKKNS